MGNNKGNEMAVWAQSPPVRKPDAGFSELAIRVPQQPMPMGMHPYARPVGMPMPYSDVRYGRGNMYRLPRRRLRRTVSTIAAVATLGAGFAFLKGPITRKYNSYQKSQQESADGQQCVASSYPIDSIKGVAKLCAKPGSYDFSGLGQDGKAVFIPHIPRVTKDNIGGVGIELSPLIIDSTKLPKGVTDVPANPAILTAEEIRDKQTLACETDFADLAIKIKKHAAAWATLEVTAQDITTDPITFKDRENVQDPTTKAWKSMVLNLGCEAAAAAAPSKAAIAGH